MCGTYAYYCWAQSLLAYHADYSGSAVGHSYAVWQAHLIRAFVNNLKCIYTSACVDNVDCIKFVLGLYADIVVSYVHMTNLHMWHIYGIIR